MYSASASGSDRRPRGPSRAGFLFWLLIAGMAGTAFPRFLLSAPSGVAEAATMGVSQTPPPSGDSADDDPADTTGVTQPVAPDTTGARADSTRAPQGFASEAPETLRYIPPSDLPAETPPAVAGAHAPPPPAADPNRPYGPMPRGGAAPGEAPKERVGLLGLHPAAIILGLVALHVLIVRVVTR